MVSREQILKSVKYKYKRKRDHDKIYLPKVMMNRGSLHEMAVEKWSSADGDVRTKMARMASAAAWGLGEFVRTYNLLN